MKAIVVSIKTDVIINNDELENIKDDCYYAINEAIENYLERNFNLRVADIPVSTYNEIQKTIVESMYQDYHL